MNSTWNKFRTIAETFQWIEPLQNTSQLASWRQKNVERAVRALENTLHQSSKSSLSRALAQWRHGIKNVVSSLKRTLPELKQYPDEFESTKSVLNQRIQSIKWYLMKIVQHENDTFTTDMEAVIDELNLNKQKYGGSWTQVVDTRNRKITFSVYNESPKNAGDIHSGHQWTQILTWIANKYWWTYKVDTSLKKTFSATLEIPFPKEF